MFRWKRVGAATVFVWLTGIVALGAVVTAVSVLVGDLHEGVLWIGVLLVVIAAIAWRISRLGFYVGTNGVRKRSFLTTRTVRWAEVAGIDAFQTGTPKEFEIRIELKDGEPLRTGVLFRESLTHRLIPDPASPLDSFKIMNLVSEHRGEQILEQLRAARPA